MFKLALVAVAIALVAPAMPAGACECGGQPTPSVAVTKASYVFEGRVVSISSRQSLLWRVSHPKQWFSDPDPSATYRQGYGVVVKIDVTRAWKGKVGPHFVVVTGTGSGDCGFEFTLGRDYLVYTRGDAAPETDICTRTALTPAAAPDLAYLKAFASGQGAKP
jgi:hypothetical protein